MGLRNKNRLDRFLGLLHTIMKSVPGISLFYRIGFQDNFIPCWPAVIDFNLGLYFKYCPRNIPDIYQG